MKFNLKLFVLVGVFVGLRDVLGVEEVKNEDDGFIVAGSEKNEELSAAIGKVSIIKAVYETEEGGDVFIIQEGFKGQLSSIVVWDGNKWVTVQDFKAMDTSNWPKIVYNMQANVKYTVYFIFKQEGVNSTKCMFRGCSHLISADFTNFNTENVTDMSLMFDGCSALTKLNLSNFVTKEVTDMFSMFDKCSSLKDLNLSDFDTTKVTNMSYMFTSCSSLNNLDLSKFDTTNVLNMAWMFFGCIALTKLNLSNFDTQNVTAMTSMFSNCSSLTKLDLRNFNTKKVDYVNSMFNGCISLNEVYLPSTCADQEKKRICCCKYVESVYLNGQKIEDLNPNSVYLVEPENIIKENLT